MLLLLARPALIALAAAIAASAGAQSSPTLAEPAQSESPQAADSFAAEVEAARGRLASKVYAFERRVNPATTFGAGWLDYLSLDDVRSQLTEGVKPDVGAAQRTLAQLNSGAAGLEVAEARRLAGALSDYVAVATLARAKDPAATIERQGEALRALMAKERLDPRLDPYAAERRLALLAATSSGASVTQEARAAYGQPNLVVRVGTGLLNRMLASPGAECVDVDDCILGTRVRGSGLSNSTLSVTTVPALDRARLRFSLAGTTRSRTRGVNGPVAIRSVANTRFQASKTVELSAEAFRMLAANATAQNRSQTKSISKIGGGLGSRLVERIASGRVADQRPLADSIAGRRASGRVASRLDERLNERLIEARRRYDERLIQRLRRRGAEPRYLGFSTTSQSLEVRSIQASTAQLAAPGSPPETLSGPMAVLLHESAISNLLSAYLSGATLRREEPDGPPIYEGGVEPDWIGRLGDRDRPTLAEFKPWAITFRRVRPISVGFSDGRVTLAVHAAEIATGEKTYEGWDLIASYKPVRAGAGWALEREGDVEVLPTGFDPASGRSLPSQKGALRANLQAALNEADGRLPSRAPLDEIVFDRPAGSVRGLSIDEIAIDGGWLQTAWRAF